MQPVVKDICRVMQSDRPLNGYIEVRGHFSLFPAVGFANISDASVPPWRDSRLTRSEPDPKFGPPFPLVIQVKIPEPLEAEFGLENAHRKLEIYSHLVCLLFHGVEPFPRTKRDGTWVGEWKVEREHVEYRIAHPGFAFDDSTYLETYVNAGGTRAPDFSGENYFDSIPYPKEVCVPSFLNEFFDIYKNLTESRRSDFDRASFLFWQAGRIRDFGGDPNPTFVSAVECLFEKTKAKICETCKAPKLGLGERYKSFLSSYAASSDLVMAAQKQMYGTRSKSVHGRRVSRFDYPSFGSDEFFENDLLFPWLTRKALVNWLLAQNVL